MNMHQLFISFANACGPRCCYELIDSLVIENQIRNPYLLRRNIELGDTAVFRGIPCELGVGPFLRKS